MQVVQEEEIPMLERALNAVRVFTSSPNPIAAQNASGVLGFLASEPSCCSVIAESVGMVNAVAAHLGSTAAPTSRDLQHNAAFLVGQLARHSLFRNAFSADALAMEGLCSLLQVEDSDVVCNALAALRTLVSDCVTPFTVVPRSTIPDLKALIAADENQGVVENAKALLSILRRPAAITTQASGSDEAAAGALASILHTPPPSASVNLDDHSTEKSTFEKDVVTKRKMGEELEWESHAHEQEDPAAPRSQMRRVDSNKEGDAVGALASLVAAADG